jgi:hypothetical protein
MKSLIEPGHKRFDEQFLEVHHLSAVIEITVMRCPYRICLDDALQPLKGGVVVEFRVRCDEVGVARWIHNG